MTINFLVINKIVINTVTKNDRTLFTVIFRYTAMT